MLECAFKLDSLLFETFGHLSDEMVITVTCRAHLLAKAKSIGLSLCWPCGFSDINVFQI